MIMLVTQVAPPGVGTVLFLITTPVVCVVIVATIMMTQLVTAPVHRPGIDSRRLGPWYFQITSNVWFAAKRAEAVFALMSSSFVPDPRSRRRSRRVLGKRPFPRSHPQRLRYVNSGYRIHRKKSQLVYFLEETSLQRGYPYGLSRNFPCHCVTS